MTNISKENLANIMGQRLKELRKAKKDLGQKEVADELGITKQALSSYESGRHIPDIAILVDLAEYYQCSVDYLLGRMEKLNPYATDYSERGSVNYLLHALDKVADDEGDYLADSIAGIIDSLSINKGNPQRRTFIECVTELFYTLAEYIEASTEKGKCLSEKSCNNTITSDDVATELARFSGFDDINKIMDDIKRAGIAATLTFSVNAKKALRIRTGWRKSSNSKAQKFAKNLDKVFGEEE